MNQGVNVGLSAAEISGIVAFTGRLKSGVLLPSIRELGIDMYVSLFAALHPECGLEKEV